MKKERLFVSLAHDAIAKLLAQEDRALEQRIDPLVWAFESGAIDGDYVVVHR